MSFVMFNEYVKLYFLIKIIKFTAELIPWLLYLIYIDLKINFAKSMKSRFFMFIPNFHEK